MILFLHGLNGQHKINAGTSDKLIIANEVFKDFDIIAPSFDYLSFLNGSTMILEYLNQHIINRYKIDAIIGNSFGAMVGFKLKEKLNCPAFLMNPPLKKYDFTYFEHQQKITKTDLILSINDEVVNHLLTLEFLNTNIEHDFFNKLNMNTIIKIDESHVVSEVKFEELIIQFRDKFNLKN